MAVIITPRTYSETRNIIVDKLKARREEAGFWYSNFKDNFYKAKIEDIPIYIIFTGYGELATSAALINEYDRLFRKDDPNPSAFYVGNCFAVDKSPLNLGDLVISEESISDGNVSKSIAEKVKKKYGTSANPWKLDETLNKTLMTIAKEKNVRTHYGRLYCSEEIFEDWWMDFVSSGLERGYIAGEYESAAFAVSCNYIKIRGTALLDVKDKRINGKYVVAERKKSLNTLKNIVEIIETSLR
jgi:purine-nucleoside phosphorylase